MPYRLRRNLPNDSFIQVKNATLAECKATLDSIKRKWIDVKEVSFNGEQFDVKSDKNKLVITQGERVVDEYVIEETK